MTHTCAGCRLPTAQCSHQRCYQQTLCDPCDRRVNGFQAIVSLVKEAARLGWTDE
jgi:hypothetical protein